MNDPVARAKKEVLHETRRYTVLKAARKVFEAKGLDGASIRLIAKAAGVTTGSIYPYFKGKEEIYAEVLSESLEEYKNQLLGEVGKAHDPESRFAAALTAHFAFYENRPSDLSLALYLYNGLKPRGLTPELDARLNDQLDFNLAFFRGCVRALANCSERKAEIEVGLHLSTLFGMLILHHTKRIRALHIDARSLLKVHIRQSIDRLTAVTT